MSTFDPPRSFNHERCDDAGLFQDLQPDTAADNIDNGVNATDLMKMHRFGRHPVNLSLSHRDPPEDGQCLLLYPIGQTAFVNKPGNDSKVPIPLMAMGS